jgi:hypothetical protein
MPNLKVILENREHIITVKEDLHTRFRIVEELATMYFETCPLTNCKEQLKGIPFIYWDKDDMFNIENTEIQKVLLKKEFELEELLEKEIVKQLKLKLRKGYGILFGDCFISENKDIIAIYEIQVIKNLNRKFCYEQELEELNTL